MPSVVATNGGSSRFELPALNLNFGSITDGTNIPPPPDSPVRKVPTPPKTPPAAEDEIKEDVVKTEANPENGSGVKPSPINEGQSSSNGSVAASTSGRPISQGGGSFLDDRKSKRSSGWFRRLRTGDQASKRSSMMFEEVPTTPKKTTGPPPPMIPELKDLEKDEGSLGSDLFKHIK